MPDLATSALFAKYHDASKSAELVITSRSLPPLEARRGERIFLAIRARRLPGGTNRRRMRCTCVAIRQTLLLSISASSCSLSAACGFLFHTATTLLDKDLTIAWKAGVGGFS